jgi:hypothetical protein
MSGVASKRAITDLILTQDLVVKVNPARGTQKDFANRELLGLCIIKYVVGHSI